MLTTITDTYTRVFAHPAVTDATLAFLKQPTPDRNFPGVKEADHLADGGIALALYACLLAFLIGLGMAVFGKIAKHGGLLAIGIGTVLLAIIAAAFLSNAAGYVNFGYNL